MSTKGEPQVIEGDRIEKRENNITFKKLGKANVKNEYKITIKGRTICIRQMTSI
jgi:hypothetical protein